MRLVIIFNTTRQLFAAGLVWVQFHGLNWYSILGFSDEVYSNPWIGDYFLGHQKIHGKIGGKFREHYIIFKNSNFFKTFFQIFFNQNAIVSAGATRFWPTTTEKSNRIISLTPHKRRSLTKVKAQFNIKTLLPFWYWWWSI